MRTIIFSLLTMISVPALAAPKTDTSELVAAKANLAKVKAKVAHAKRLDKLARLRTKALKASQAVKTEECLEERFEHGVPDAEAKASCRPTLVVFHHTITGTLPA